MTPFASVAMLEKLALLKIARCKAPVFSRASVCRTSMLSSAPSAGSLWAVGMCPRFHRILIQAARKHCQRQFGAAEPLRSLLLYGIGREEGAALLSACDT